MVSVWYGISFGLLAVFVFVSLGSMNLLTGLKFNSKDYSLFVLFYALVISVWYGIGFGLLAVFVFVSLGSMNLLTSFKINFKDDIFCSVLGSGDFRVVRHQLRSSRRVRICVTRINEPPNRVQIQFQILLVFCSVLGSCGLRVVRHQLRSSSRFRLCVTRIDEPPNWAQI